MRKNYIFVAILTVLIVGISFGVESEEVLVGGEVSSIQRFLHLGKTIEDQKGNFSDRQRAPYLKSLNKFPSLKSCLVGDTSKIFALDDLQLDFDRINTLQDVEVCIFWVSEHLASAGELGKWFGSMGFGVQIKEFPPHHYKNGDFDVIADWNKETYGTSSPFKFGLVDRIRQAFLHSGIVIAVSYGREAAPENVNVYFNRK